MRDAVTLLIGVLLCASSLFGEGYRSAPEHFHTPQLRLYFYACEGSVEGVDRALREGAEIDKLSERHYNALHYAIRLNRLEVVRKLLESGADVNARVSLKETRSEAKGVTPLALAAILGRTEIGLLLLEYGADPEATREHGNGWDINAVSCAIKYNRNQLVEAFVKKGIDISKPIKLWGSDYDGVPILAIAAEHGSTDQVRRLVEDYKRPVNVTAPYLEWNPLHVAVLYGNYEVAKYLIRRGADVDKLVEWTHYRRGKWSCLTLSAYEGRLELTRLLLDHGAKPIKARNRENDPVFVADALGYDKILDLYESRGYRSNFWGRLETDEKKHSREAGRRVKNVPVGSLFAAEQLSGNWPLQSGIQKLLGDSFKLAILSDERADDFASLLAVEWSQSDRIKLLERDKIDTLLKEHRFSRSGLLKGESLDAFAKLSGAQALIAIKTFKQGKEQVHELRLIDARRGILVDVRYCPVRAEGLEAFSERYAENALQRLGQINANMSGLRALSVINVRSDFGSLVGIQLEKQAHRLLEFELSRQPGVIAMQRQDLLDLKRENELAGEIKNTFLGSSGFIDARLDLNQSHNQVIALELRLQGIDGGSRLVEMPVMNGDLGPALQEAFAKLLSPEDDLDEVQRVGDATLDGEKLLKEARWLSKVGLEEEALEYVRNATALGLDNRAVWVHYLDCLEAAYPDGNEIDFSKRADFERLFAYEQERLFALNNLYDVLRKTKQRLQLWGLDAHLGFDESICRMDAVSIRRRYGDQIVLLEQDYMSLLRRHVIPMFVANKETGGKPKLYEDLLCGALQVLRSVRCTSEGKVEEVVKELVSAFWVQFEGVDFYAHSGLWLRSYGRYSIRNTYPGWTRCEQILEWVSEAGSTYMARELLSEMLSLGGIYAARKHSIRKIESIEQKLEHLAEDVRSDCPFYLGRIPIFWRDTWETNNIWLGSDRRWINPARAASVYFEAQLLRFLQEEDYELWREPVSGITSQLIWFDPAQLNYTQSVLAASAGELESRGVELFAALQEVIQFNIDKQAKSDALGSAFGLMKLHYWHPDAFGYRNCEILGRPVYHDGVWVILARKSERLSSGGREYVLFLIDAETYETHAQSFSSEFLLAARSDKTNIAIGGGWLFFACDESGPAACLNLKTLSLGVLPDYRKSQFMPVGCIASGKFYMIAASVHDVEAHYYKTRPYLLFEYDPETKEFNVLANMRRNPPENALDSANLRNPYEIRASLDGSALLLRFHNAPDFIFDLTSKTASRFKGSDHHEFYDPAERAKNIEMGIWESNGEKWWLRRSSHLQRVEHLSVGPNTLFFETGMSMKSGLRIIKSMPEYLGGSCEAYAQRQTAIDADEDIQYDNFSHNSNYGMVRSRSGDHELFGFFKTEDFAAALKESSTIAIWSD